MDHLLLLPGGQGRPDRVELGKRAAEFVCVDAVLVTGLPLRSQFRQAVFRGFDLLLNVDNPVEPRAGVQAGVAGLAGKGQVGLPEAPPMGVELLVEIPAAARHLIEGFCGNCLRQLRVGTDAADAIQHRGLNGLSGD